MRRSTSRQRSRSRSRTGAGIGSHLPGIILMCLALAAFAAGGYFWATAERRPDLDKVSLCPLDGPRSTTVILLDASDPLPDVTRREVRMLLLDTAEQVPEYGLLEIRILDPRLPGGKPLFIKCNPGTGEGLNEYTGNPHLARKKWMDDFRTPLERALEGGLTPTGSESSPILSTLQSIAVDRFSGNKTAGMSKSLIVVSDLIEHGPDYSQYQGNLSYERFRQSVAYKKVRTDLQGAEVRIGYIQRLTRRPINSAEHIRFWTDWVKDSNGRFKEARKLQGAG